MFLLNLRAIERLGDYAKIKFSLTCLSAHSSTLSYLSGLSIISLWTWENIFVYSDTKLVIDTDYRSYHIIHTNLQNDSNKSAEKFGGMNLLLYIHRISKSQVELL
jgi:hypothetical protein